LKRNLELKDSDPDLEEDMIAADKFITLCFEAIRVNKAYEV